jgi:hypothetical protein
MWRGDVSAAVFFLNPFQVRLLCLFIDDSHFEARPARHLPLETLSIEVEGVAERFGDRGLVLSILILIDCGSGGLGHLCQHNLS